jgi:hypothetical protein
MHLVGLIFLWLNSAIALLVCVIYWTAYRCERSGRTMLFTLEDRLEFVGYTLLSLWWAIGTEAVWVLPISPFWILAWILLGLLIGVLVWHLVEVSGLLYFIQMGEEAIKAKASEIAAGMVADMAAEQGMADTGGHTDSQSNTGLDQVSKQAEQGSPDAQFKLGVAYYDGKGTPQDFAQAAEWFRKAAERGHAGAQFNLGLGYFYGEGVPQSYAEAYFWLNLAASGKLETQADAAKALRDDAASHLGSTVLAQVKERCRQWFADHGHP